MQDQPRGGERNLALEEADLSKGKAISDLTTGSYVSSFGSLAGLGGQNVSQGNAATSTGLSGMNSAANQYGQLQQLNNEQKATQLGFISSLGGDAAMAAGCYVAAELYGGWNAWQTRSIRQYLYSRMRLHWAGRRLYAAYCQYGRGWAESIKTHLVWRWIAARIFSVLLRLSIQNGYGQR